MQYLNSTFSVGPAANTNGVLCEACVFKHGTHSAECKKARIAEAMCRAAQEKHGAESVH